MSELLNCPFCGLDVTNDEGCFPLNREKTAWEVSCGNPECFGHSPDAPTREEAIAKWNRRPHPAGAIDLEQFRAAVVAWKYEGETRYSYNGVFHLKLGPNHYRAMELLDIIDKAKKFNQGN